MVNYYIFYPILCHFIGLIRFNRRNRTLIGRSYFKGFPWPNYFSGVKFEGCYQGPKNGLRNPPRGCGNPCLVLLFPVLGVKGFPLNGGDLLMWGGPGGPTNFPLYIPPVFSKTLLPLNTKGPSGTL